MGRRDSLKNCWGATPVSVRVRPSAPFPVAELCSGSTGDFGSLSPGSNPGSAAMNSQKSGMQIPIFLIFLRPRT